MSQILITIFVMIPLGAIIGPFMALSFPFSWVFKILYSIGLIISLTSFIFGVRKRKHVFTILGIIAWTILGLVGLGTGV